MLQSRRARYALLGACLALLIPATALAQEGTIAGTVRDESGGALPGVTIEVTSPALIGIRSTVSDNLGQYRITNLPVGTYTVVFTLSGFQRQQRDNVELTSGFTANVSPALGVGNIQETISVTADPPVVDVQNARQAITFTGAELQELPTSRNIVSLLGLTPGIGSSYRPGTAYGICNGGVGTFCSPAVQAFDQGEEIGGSLLTTQGQVKVDGMVLNSNASLTQSVAGGPIAGMLGGYMADIANAQEVTIQLSGALGESETGGATINIVPRTGGNRYAGHFNTTYSTESWFAKNNAKYEDITVTNPIKYNYDVSGAYGGPIIRDRLWFYSVVRDQGKRQVPGGGDFFPNLHYGKWGYNYQPDRPAGVLDYTNRWQNVNARFTLQASAKNKFNIFWDEQNFCQDPCHGMVATFVAPEAWWSVQVQPNRLQQLSWTNPLTNRILLEARASVTRQDNRTDRHLEWRNPREIPRVSETGTTAGGDDVAPRVNNTAGLGGPFALSSGSLNTDLIGTGSRAQRLDSDNTRWNASASYVTGSHNFKVGYDGAIIAQALFNQANDPRMTYNYTQPSTNVCNPFVNPALTACGNTHLGNEFVGPQFSSFEEQNNYYRRPRPSSVLINTGQGRVGEELQTHAVFAQDQWTFKRLTLSGAVRYDRATSHYDSTCVDPDVFVPEENAYCTGEHDGVSFNDVSPRFQVVYDLFGRGRTAVKFNYGKYLGQAALSGVYAAANPARRTSNNVTVNWNDVDGDRIVDCNILGMLAQARVNHANGVTSPNNVPDGECSGFTGGSDTLRFGRSPFVLDAEGNLPGLSLTQCGLEFGVLPEVLEYCDAYGESLTEGWGRRDYRWQSGLGIQHELLPRLSVEVTWNRRRTNNVTVTDRLGLGCDRFLAAVDVRTCNESFLNYTHPDYHFYSYVAPQDPRLPGGGGYRVTGLTTGNNSVSNQGAQVQTFMEERRSTWNGIDTNFVWRGPGGLRLNGGTSSGYSRLNTCYAQLDAPDVRGRDGDYAGGCDSASPWNTRINGTVAYVIPWVDVLASGVFQGFRGVARSANVQDVHKNQVTWEPSSQSRLNDPCTGTAEVEGFGCFGIDRASATTDVNVLMDNEMFGERIMLFDLKLAKNIRFKGRRLVVGVDVFNVLNSDAIDGYNNNYILPENLEPGEVNPWGEPTSLVSPRFAQLSIQFDF